MTAEELWRLSKLNGEYEAWAFGGDPDGLAALVKDGIKRATSSAYVLYQLEQEPLPKGGEYSVILDGLGEAVCIIQTTKVSICPYSEIPESFAFKEGEGDRSLTYWRRVHKDFFTQELGEAGLSFAEDMEVVCEEFEVVFQC